MSSPSKQQSIGLVWPQVIKVPGWEYPTTVDPKFDCLKILKSDRMILS